MLRLGAFLSLFLLLSLAGPLEYSSFIKMGFAYRNSLDIEKGSKSSDFYKSVIKDVNYYPKSDPCEFSNLDEYYSIPFNSELYHLSNKYNIIAVNENHNIPKHRIAFSKMLHTLKHNGFTHIAFEGVSMEDSLLNVRKYPKFLESGFYLREPNYANLVRIAMDMEFYVFGYDDMRSDDREEKQAENICDRMVQDSIQKLIIFCGHDHLVKGANTSLGKTMARYLSEYTDEYIFSISQTEVNCTPFQHTIEYCEEDMFVLKAKDESYFSSFEKDRGIDMALFMIDKEHALETPFLKYHRYLNYKIPADIDEYTLILAFDKSEKENPVPIDVVEYCPDKAKPHLILPSGDYRLEYYNSKHERIAIYDLIL